MDAVSEVKARLGIEDVISEYVQLKRMGRNYKGLSPWTNEKTPSFVVSPEKQIWHDFSSARGGDIFTFIQEVEGLDFKGALELLARKAGVDLEQYQQKDGSKSKLDKERLYKALEHAEKFYQSQLIANKEALEYVRIRRGFSKQTMLDFRLGYSPAAQNACVNFLKQKNYSDQELKLAGLANEHRGELRDMFRGRVMIPLADSMGRTIGFTARLLEDNPKAPKYINTASTPLYDKSRHIYGLHLAKQAIRQHGNSIMVEGNLDVIASHQAGYKQVVATAGTALTEQQLKILSRFAPDVRLAFDQDRAGLEATERAIPLASKTNVNLKIITIPTGKDPDELIKKDPKAWAQAIDKAEYALDWLIDRYVERIDIKSAEGKKELSSEMIKVIKNLNDPVEQDHYIQKLANIVGVDISSLRKKLNADNSSNTSQIKKSPKLTQISEPENQDRIRAIDRLLCLALTLPGTRGYLEFVISEMLVNDNQKNIFKFLRAHPDFDGNVKQAEALKETADFVKILSLQFDELYAQVDTLELQYEAARLRAKIIEYYVKQQKIKLSTQLTQTKESEHSKILEAVRELDKLLNRVKD